MSDMSHPNKAPRVAVTDFRAQFGGPQRRAWNWPISSRNEQSTLRDLTAAARADYAVGIYRRKNLRDLSCELQMALQQWEVWPTHRPDFDAERAAVVFSSSKGDVFQLERDRQQFQAQDYCLETPTSLRWTGDNFAAPLAPGLRRECPVAACASGSHAIARGAQMIRWGQMDWVLCGAVEASLSPLIMTGYRQLGALSCSGVMRPFDRRRDGFVPSEGLGALVLENEECALERGAKIYGYVTGWDMGADATSLTGLESSGQFIARAMERALERAGNPKIDYINAHGTATLLNDLIESRAIKSVFGQNVPVSSTKPLTGHLLGAAGAVEAALCLQAFCEQWAPPTLNLEEPDGECDLDYIPVSDDGGGRTLPLRHVMSLNYGFGGHIGVLIFESVC